MYYPANWHTHTVWCDGKDSPAAMAEAAVAAGFKALGFTSHAMLPVARRGYLSPETAPKYAAEVRSLRGRFAGRLEVFCGVEADYLPGSSTPESRRYAEIAPDYMIGSVHWAVAEDGAAVPVDDTPEKLARGIKEHFGGDVRAFVRTYFAMQREMAASFDFDIIGHPDLVRKFNRVLGLFDEAADWYMGELEAAADAFAKSGKIVELLDHVLTTFFSPLAFISCTLLRSTG